MLRRTVATILSFIGIVFILAGSFDMMVFNTALFWAVVFFMASGLSWVIFSSGKKWN